MIYDTDTIDGKVLRLYPINGPVIVHRLSSECGGGGVIRASVRKKTEFLDKSSKTIDIFSNRSEAGEILII